MLVYVQTPKEQGEGKSIIPIWFPTILLFNHLTVVIAWVVMRTAMKDKDAIPSLRRLFGLLHAVWRCKMCHPLLPLVSLDRADGTRIKIQM